MKNTLILFTATFITFVILATANNHNHPNEKKTEGENNHIEAMAGSTPLILRLVSSCIPAANHAGKIIRDILKKGELNIVDKGVKDFQTEADRRAQQFIISVLSRRFSKATIIGEEGALGSEGGSDTDFNEVDESILSKECPKDLLDVNEDQVTIWVDPLDGTSEFTQGLLDHVTVLIGIAVGTKAVAGVIHQPYYGYKEEKCCGRTIWGIVGLGAYGHSPLELPSNRISLTTTRSHSNALVEDAINALKPDEVLRVGGAGHKVLLVLERRVHAYLFASQGCKRWDTCAPEAILHAAGGLLTDLNGNLYPYNKETDVNNEAGILATAKKEDHSKFLNLLPDSIRKSFEKPKSNLSPATN